MKKKAVSGGRRAYIRTMRILMGAAAIITAALVLFLIAYVLIKGLPNVSWALLSTAPSYLSDRIGILPDILNTLYIILLSMVIVSAACRMEAAEYLFYLAQAGAFGLIPFILLAAGVVSVPYPSVICAGVSLLFLLGLVIFKGKEFVREIKKKFRV